MKKIDIASLPELKTSVGVHGSAKLKEIGGSTCAGIFVVIVSGG
ncbi:MAG TPA: hypothetical protein VF652_06550 [Allosphingosinicella sp.]